MATIAYEVIGNTMLLAHAPEPPSDGEWDAYVDALVTSAAVTNLLVWTDGVGPNAVQRKRLKARMERRDIPTAVVTPSIMARGIVTALRWAGISIRAFEPEELAAAIEHAQAMVRREDVLRTGVALRLRVLDGDPGAVDALPLETVEELARSSSARLVAFSRGSARRSSVG